VNVVVTRLGRGCGGGVSGWEFAECFAGMGDRVCGGVGNGTKGVEEGVETGRGEMGSRGVDRM
jgi:hypothetical protein